VKQHSSRRRFVVLSALALGLSGLSVPRADALQPRATPLEKIHALVQPSVVYEQITWTSRIYDSFNRDFLRDQPFQVSSGCTGFVVAPDGYVATAGHCVEFEDDVQDALLDQAAQWVKQTHYYTGNFSLQTIRRFADEDYRLRSAEGRGNRPDRDVAVAYGVAASGLGTGEAKPAQVVSFRGFEEGDVALLKIEAEDLSGLVLAPEEDVSVGTEVVSVGYAASVDAVTDVDFAADFKDGSISNVRTIGGGLVEVYETSAALTGGMSGGPTVDLQGRVIGINSFGIIGEDQPFNFISPAQHLTELLADAGVENDLGEVGRLYREGITAYFAGDKTTALGRLGRVLQLVPSHELAQEFRTKAARLPNPPPESSPLLWILIGVGVLVVAGVVVMLLVLRGRRGRAAPAVAPAGAAAVPGAGPAGVAPPAAAVPPAPPAEMPTAELAAAKETPAAPPAIAKPSPTQPGPVVLRISRGPGAGREYQVGKETVLGREEADIVLADSEVSARHAMVRPADGDLEIEDLGSLNGTWVNGTRLRAGTSVRIGPGAVIQAGESFLEVLGPGGDRGPAT
jgi:serine protease Do